MKALIRVLLPFVVIGLGIAIMVGLVKTKPKANERPADELGELVEVAELEASTERVEVVARGTVVPARQVILSPEVSGRVIAMNTALTPGGILKAGETALRVDARDYRLALEQQRAAVNRAETELAIEKSRKTVAEKEWERFGSKRGGTASPLATREPQLKSAEVAVASAQSGVKQARLRVSRTAVKAPFNGIVQSRQVEVGQVVAAGTPVATFVGTDAYWVQVSVPVSQITWFAIPGVAGATEGAVVEVRQKVGDETQIREGRVVRLLGDVDPAGRMARILVEIPNPLETRKAVLGEEKAAPGATLPLLLNSYVEVAIAAREVEDVFVLPRAAIRDGDKAFVMVDGKLQVRELEILWRKRDTVLVGGGLANGEKLVVTPIAAPVDGMKLRVVGDDATKKDAKPDEKAAVPEPAGAKSVEVAQ